MDDGVQVDSTEGGLAVHSAPQQCSKKVSVMAKNARSSNGSKSERPIVEVTKSRKLSGNYDDYRATGGGKSWFDTTSGQTIPAWQFDEMFRTREAVAA